MTPKNKDTLALLAKNIAVEMHAHHAVQLVVSLDSAYPATLDGREFSTVRGFLIDRDVPHACQSEHSTLLVTSVDAETVKGRKLRRILNRERFRLIEEILPTAAIEDFTNSYKKVEQNAFDYSELLARLTENGESPGEPDQRIARAVDFVADNIDTKFKIMDVAAAVNLSESRLRHLFAEKVGISLSSYVLWTRMKLALKELLKTNANLSDAAHRAGFSDHAHFTRNFRRMFGVPPSLLARYVEFLQVFDL